MFGKKKIKRDKNGFIDIAVHDLIQWNGGNGDGCIVSNKITKDGWKVGFMRRTEPAQQYPDSGWQFMAGDEDDDYMDDPNNHNIFKLNTICNYDPDIIEYLNAPAGTDFIRVSNTKFEIDDGSKPIFMAKQEH